MDLRTESQRTRAAQAARVLPRPLRRATSGALAATLCLFVFATSATAGPPNHPRAEALDISGFNHACGTAVDSEGDVYVASSGESKIKVFDSAHTEIGSITNGLSGKEPCGLAVDTDGNLYVSERAVHEVVRYHPTAYPFSGAPSYEPPVTVDASGEAEGIAVDPFDDRLYVAKGTKVDSYDSDGTLGIDEIQRVFPFNATGGTYKLSLNGEETAALGYEATHLEVKEALEDLPLVGPGDISVTQGPNASGRDHIISFGGALAKTNVPQIGCDKTSLTGPSANCFLATQVNGFSGHLAEGELTQATGVATYTYQSGTRYLYVAEAATDQVKIFSGADIRNLKLRRTIDGPEAGEDFEFGPAGAYLAADPGNRSGNGCASVAEQACTAGHLLVYDAGHEILDEFDATGEFLDRIESSDFEDAEPTAMAIDRSGGPNDGTIYVTAGASASAELLGFAPLVTPRRNPIKDLSHVLTGAWAVATDPYGNVYVASFGRAAIKVFGPNGEALTTFEDTRRAYDLAVDSQCNVYVLDGDPGVMGGITDLTYYEPSACPPGPGASFTRKPPVVSSPVGKKAVAVDPSNDHVFLAGDSRIVEFDSAAEGSAQARECGPASNPLDIAVYGGGGGASSRVYVASNSPGRIVAIDCGEAEGEEEVLAETQGGGGCPGGPFGATPSIAVDQSNGHVLEFQEEARAREYDAALSCVAEYGTFASTGFGGFFAYGIAIDNGAHSPNKGTVYVASDAADNTVQPYDVTAFEPLSYGGPPKATTGLATDLGPGEATLNGTVNPNGFELEECRFQYLSEEDYEDNGKTFAGAEDVACAETLEEIGGGDEGVEVHAEIGSVQPQTTKYRFRLLAANRFGEDAGEGWPFGPPEPSEEKALPVLYDEATLLAEVDPSGLQTKYWFEYGTAAGEYDRSTPATTLPAGDGKVAIEAPLTGLQEGTAYYFQLVTENEAQTVRGIPDLSFETLQRLRFRSCPNTEYRTGLSAKLPECRAYELVTPADTRNAKPAAGIPPSAGGTFNQWLAAPRGAGAGESLAFSSITLPGFEGSGDVDGYRSTRSSGAHPSAGWQTQLYSPTYAQGGAGDEGVSADQRYWLFAVAGEERTLPLGHYVRVPEGTANPVCNVAPNNDPANFQDEFELVGCGSLGTDRQATSRFLSTGGNHLVFFSDEHLEAAAAPAGTQAIYDRKAGAASAEVVSVKPDGSAFGAGEGATYVGASEDGSTVLFKVGGTLYAHRGGESTEIVSGTHTFAGISEDGARAFYIDASFPLVNPPPPAGLFACEVEAGSCTEFAADSILVGISPDGSHAFFTSEDDLAPGEANDNGEEATATKHNLYAWDGTSTRFVAILDDADFDRFGTSLDAVNMEGWVRSINPGQNLGRAAVPTRSTPAGEVFVFQSHASLSAYDNEGAGEIYRYAPAAPAGERLLCVSCDPTAAPPGGDAMLQVYDGVAGGRTQSTTLIANVTDDGRAVFFHSPDRLLPEDANQATDVYEWKAKGTGVGSEQCQRASGCLALISSGQGEDQSTLYGMSADGHDVFFSTVDQLVGADLSDTSSLYDARVEGGIPSRPPLAPCQGDACQGEGSTAPNVQAPASTAPLAGGDVTPARSRSCPKGKRKVKSKGKVRCVKKHRKKPHRKHKQGHGRSGR